MTLLVAVALFVFAWTEQTTRVTASPDLGLDQPTAWACEEVGVGVEWCRRQFPQLFGARQSLFRFGICLRNRRGCTRSEQQHEISPFA